MMTQGWKLQGFALSVHEEKIFEALFLNMTGKQKLQFLRPASQWLGSSSRSRQEKYTNGEGQIYRQMSDEKEGMESQTRKLKFSLN